MEIQTVKLLGEELYVTIVPNKDFESNVYQILGCGKSELESCHHTIKSIMESRDKLENTIKEFVDMFVDEGYFNHELWLPSCYLQYENGNVYCNVAKEEEGNFIPCFV